MTGFVRTAAAVLMSIQGIAIVSAHAQTNFTVIHNFSVEGGFWPFAGVTPDAAGNLWGTTSSSVVSGAAGGVFELKNRDGNWLYQPLFYFDIADGASPFSGVAFGPDGALFGTTIVGGMGCSPNSGCGLVYALTAPGTFCGGLDCQWTENVLYEFSGGSDGADPTYGNVIFDGAGNVYGTADAGGAYNKGAVFELVHSNGGWTEQVLYSFRGGSDGDQPVGGLVFDSAGNLYGTTIAGGPLNCGTVFELSPNGSGWTETILHEFLCAADGQGPIAAPILDQAGNLYGSTFYGGTGNGGVVYELSPVGNGNWNFTTLYAIPQGPHGGRGPYSSLAMDASGALYGTTHLDGSYGAGNVFKLTPANGGWSYTTLHDFTGVSDGAWPYGPVLDSQGNLYGTTYTGGANLCATRQGCGVVWEIMP